MQNLASSLVSLAQTVGALKLELAKAHRALANGAYGSRRSELESEVCRLEAAILRMGFRP